MNAIEKGLRLGGRVLLVDSLRDDEAPEAHQRANRRVHRREVAIERRNDGAADMDFGATAEIRAHDRAERDRVEVFLNLAPRPDAHLLQIGLAEAGFGIDASAEPSS